MKPHEETWEWSGTNHITWEHPDYKHTSTIAEFGTNPHEEARARLASFAPAMARLLMDLAENATIGGDYYGTDPGCASCSCPKHHHPLGHDPGCKLMAVLRAAGVIE